MNLYLSQKWTLASASPRRLALLRQIGIEPEVIPAHIDEIEDGDDPAALALRNADTKRLAVQGKVKEGFVLAADTMVTLDGSILGKPGDHAEAVQTLKILSGRAHTVITAWSLGIAGSESTEKGVETTQVFFRELSDDEIHHYVASGEPMDKAGAYGIQGAAAAFVLRIEGCYFNVVGLPVASVLRHALSLMNQPVMRSTRPKRSTPDG